MVDRNNWTPPEAPQRITRQRVPGALGGSRLLDLPALAALRAEIEAFTAVSRPLAVEVGFDFGEVIFDQATRHPEIQWLGLEIRKARVAELAARAPANCLAARLDARSLFASGMLDARASRIDILFPTPALNGRHLLWTPAFVADVARCLAPGGTLTAETDVPALASLIEELLAGWPEAPCAPRAAALSRRERVCRRDALPTWRFSRHAPNV